MVGTIHRKAINFAFAVNARAEEERRHTLGGPASNDGMIDPCQCAIRIEKRL